MTPYKQIVMHNPDAGVYGDCYRTAIGCLLDLHPSQLPNFVGDALSAGLGQKEAEVAAKAWLKERGYALLSFAFLASHKEHGRTMFGDTPYLLTGQSPNYDCAHTTVGRWDFEVLWDPASSGKGLAGPYKDPDVGDVYFVEFIVPLTQYHPNHNGVTV